MSIIDWKNWNFEFSCPFSCNSWIACWPEMSSITVEFGFFTTKFTFDVISIVDELCLMIYLYLVILDYLLFIVKEHQWEHVFLWDDSISASHRFTFVETRINYMLGSDKIPSINDDVLFSILKKHRSHYHEKMIRWCVCFINLS